MVAACHRRLPQQIQRYFLDLTPLDFETLGTMKSRNKSLHDTLHKHIYGEATKGGMSELDISTVLNVNREIYSSNESLLTAICSSTLVPAERQDFQNSPGF